MGRTITPPYRLRLDNMVMAWKGVPSEKALREYVFKYADSLKLGGCNEHISKSLGYIPYPYKAQIEENRPDGAIVAQWKAGMFQVF